jgi:hypothetical protein
LITPFQPLLFEDTEYFSATSVVSFVLPLSLIVCMGMARFEEADEDIQKKPQTK